MMTELSITRGRRYISKAEKVRIVEELYSGDLGIAEVARINKVGVSSLMRWKKQYSEGGSMSVKSDDEVISKKEYQKLQKQNSKLERMLGRKTLETEVLKEAIIIAREKKLISESDWLKVKGLVEE